MLVAMQPLTISLSLLLSLLAGCASQPPTAIGPAPAENPSITAVQAGEKNYTDHLVRWGGEIIQVHNRTNSTDIKILARDLTTAGRPKTGIQSAERFIARFQGFLEPEEYLPGTLITLIGRLTSTEQHKVGEYLYTYPVVEVTEQHLWPKLQPVHAPYYRYDPLYNPWWPYHPYRHPYHPYWW